MAKTPQVGEQAPDFELPGTDGPFKLSEHRGERVVLLFYPGDNTMVCTKQFCSYRDRAEDFAALDATVVGISSQDLDSHEGFIAKHSLNVPLLSDVDRQVASSYSAFSPRLGIKRAVIVIDEQGVVRARHDHMLGLDYQSVDELQGGAGYAAQPGCLSDRIAPTAFGRLEKPNACRWSEDMATKHDRALASNRMAASVWLLRASTGWPRGSVPARP